MKKYSSPFSSTLRFCVVSGWACSMPDDVRWVSMAKRDVLMSFQRVSWAGNRVHGELQQVWS